MSSIPRHMTEFQFFSKEIFMALASAIERAKLLNHIYKENGGILLIAGSTKKAGYDDKATLSGLMGSLDKDGLPHMIFEQMLIDLHTKNRRYRQVKVVISRELFQAAYREIVMSDALKQFQDKCKAHQSEITAWILRKNKLLLTVSAGEESQALHKILDTTGNLFMNVPVLSFLHSGNLRKERPAAFVYGIRKPT